MEDVLDVYAQPPDARHPLVCFDERLCLLIENVHEPIPQSPKTEERPAQNEKIDYEYERNGTCNLFAFLVSPVGGVGFRPAKLANPKGATHRLEAY